MIKKLIVYLVLCCFINMFAMKNLCFAAAVNVKAGKQISVIAEKKVNSKDLQAGDKINMYIENDVLVDGIKVFKKGDPASLNVSDARKARYWGVPGELFIVNGSIKDINANDHRIEFQQKLTGEEKNYPKVLGAAAIFLLFPLFLFGFVKGGQAEVLPNIPLKVTVSDDFTFIQKL